MVEHKQIVYIAGAKKKKAEQSMKKKSARRETAQIASMTMMTALRANGFA